jgi:hypothetical protein
MARVREKPPETLRTFAAPQRIASLKRRSPVEDEPAERRGVVPAQQSRLLVENVAPPVEIGRTREGGTTAHLAQALLKSKGKTI